MAPFLGYCRQHHTNVLTLFSTHSPILQDQDIASKLPIQHNAFNQNCVEICIVVATCDCIHVCWLMMTCGVYVCVVHVNQCLIKQSNCVVLHLCACALLHVWYPKYMYVCY